MIPQRLLAFFALCAVPALAVDEFLPVAPGKVEISAAYSPLWIRGEHRNFGTTEGDEGDGGPDMAHIAGLQLKAGLARGLDLEIQGVMQFIDAESGFERPRIGLKYMLGETGLGVSGDLILGLATGPLAARNEIETGWRVAPGLLFHRDFGRFNAVAQASYDIGQLVDDFGKGFEVDAFLKPGFRATSSLLVFAGAAYSHRGKTGDGESAGMAYQVTALPGVLYTPNSRFALEAVAPFTIAGRRTYGYFGLGAQVYVTLF